MRCTAHDAYACDVAYCRVIDRYRIRPPLPQISQFVYGPEEHVAAGYRGTLTRYFSAGIDMLPRLYLSRWTERRPDAPRPWALAAWRRSPRGQVTTAIDYIRAYAVTPFELLQLFVQVDADEIEEGRWTIASACKASLWIGYRGFIETRRYRLVLMKDTHKKEAWYQAMKKALEDSAFRNGLVEGIVKKFTRELAKRYPQLE